MLYLCAHEVASSSRCPSALAQNRASQQPACPLAIRLVKAGIAKLSPPMSEAAKSKGTISSNLCNPLPYNPFSRCVVTSRDWSACCALAGSWCVILGTLWMRSRAGS